MASKIYEEFLKFRDKFGMNQLDSDGVQGGVTQNGALFTIEYVLCLMAYADDPEIKAELEQEIERLKGVYNSLEPKPGITWRFPGSMEFDSMDNGSGIHAFSALFDDGKMALRKIEHGETTRAEFLDTLQDPKRAFQFYPIAWILSGFKPPRFFWNIEQPTYFCLPGWHGRSPGHMAMMRLCAGRKVGLFGHIAMWVGQFLGCFKPTGDTDARKLPYVDWQVLKNINWFWKLSYKLWCWILIKQYGEEGMRAVYKIYYGFPGHPLPKYSPPYLK